MVAAPLTTRREDHPRGDRAERRAAQRLEGERPPGSPQHQDAAASVRASGVGAAVRDLLARRLGASSAPVDPPAASTRGLGHESLAPVATPTVVLRACAGCAAAASGGSERGDEGSEPCPSCRNEQGAGGTVMPRRAGDGGGPPAEPADEVPADVASEITAARAGGTPLNPGIRAQFESRLDADLAGVRLHTSATDNVLARRLGARAFTYGQDIFFGAAEYRPSASSGQRLLAHELAHTLQRPAAGPSVKKMALSHPGDALEEEADRFADDVLTAAPARPPLMRAAEPAVMGQMPAAAPVGPVSTGVAPVAPVPTGAGSAAPVSTGAGSAAPVSTAGGPGALTDPTAAGIIDDTCAWMRQNGQLPSQRGVGWKGHPTPRLPTSCNIHPDAPYLEDPGIESRAKCRGVCGPDCAKNCSPQPDRMRCAETVDGHFICEYKGVQTCGTHDGCRHHDACYDWCSANGDDSIYDSCHRWCDMGCICEYGVGQCVGWARGNGPFDAWMTFYDETISRMHGPFEGPCPPEGMAVSQVDAILGLGDPELILQAVAARPLAARLHIAASSEVIQLELALGPALWALARRILAGAPSVAVPSLDEATWFLADLAIRGGDFARALDAILGFLVDRGLADAATQRWEYVPRDDRGEARTSFTFEEDPRTHERVARRPVTVEVYVPAFQDVGWLFSSVMHERIHVLQVLAGQPGREFDVGGQQRPEFVHRNEVEAYLWEIEHAAGSGLIGDARRMRDLGERLTDHFTPMTAALQEQYRPRYNLAQQRVHAAVQGMPQLSVDEARRILQESSTEIQVLLRQRPGNEAVIDARIEAVRRRRSEALITVALADNPATEVVRPGEPGTYRVPTVDAEGRVRYLHGGIQVAWHLAATSPSAYTLGEALGVGGAMAVAGTAVQGRVHPFPPDVDFDEHVHVVADTARQAGRLAARQIIGGIRRISGGRVPGRPDIEFRHLLAFPRGDRTVRMSLGDVNSGGAETFLGAVIARLNGGQLNTFWRGYIVDDAAHPTQRRFIALTRVIFVTAATPDGRELLTASSSADLNLAYLQDPNEIPTTSLANFAWQMCCAAVDRAGRHAWLKAAKRAYNYFSTIGDTQHMAALEPVFVRPETNVEQYASVIDGIEATLATRDMRLPQPRTRILTEREARNQVESVAVMVERNLRAVPGRTPPDQVTRALRADAEHLRSRDRHGNLAQDDDLAAQFGLDAAAIRELIDGALEDQVRPIIEGVLRPVCPPGPACQRR